MLGGVLVAAGWVAAPFVNMAVRGTVDQRHVEGWRTEGPEAAAPVVAIPAPRAESTPRVPRTISA